MSTAPSRSGLASTCTDRSTEKVLGQRRFAAGGLAGLLALIVLLGGGRAAAAAGTSYLERELELARSGGIYLVLYPASGTGERAAPPSLEVRVRGMTLETIPLQRLALMRPRSFFAGEPGAAGAGAAELPELPPAAWVVSDLRAEHRRVIVPRELRPLESAPEAAPSPGSAADELPAAPDAYFVELRPLGGAGEAETQASTAGWRLVVDRELPHARAWQRVMGALGAGWSRLWGQPDEPAGLLALAVPAPQAQRLHHLLRPGVVLLLDARPRTATTPIGGSR